MTLVSEINLSNASRKMLITVINLSQCNYRPWLSSPSIYMYYCYIVFLNEGICASCCGSAYGCGAIPVSRSRHPFWCEAGGTVIRWCHCLRQQAALVCKLTSFLHPLLSAAFCRAALNANCHVLSLAWCCPDGAFSCVSHCHVSISVLSTVCRAFPADSAIPDPEGHR